MGSTRKFNRQRSRSTSPKVNGEGAKIVKFDRERRTSRKPIVPLAPKRPERRERPQRMALGEAVIKAVRRVISFLFGSPSGGRRPRSRGSQPSGKRRA